MYSADSGHGAAPQRVARRTTMTPKYSPAPFMSAPAPHRSYSPPPYHPSPPAVSNSSGQYKSGGGGGAPSAPPVAHQGHIGGVGANHPAPHGNNGGGGGGRKAPAHYQGGKKNQPAPKPKAPSIPSIDAYLNSDNQYQQGLSELLKQIADYQNQNNMDVQNAKDTLATTLGRMGDERTNALKSIEADYASRGLLNSGLYADAVNDYNTNYQNQVTDLNTNEQQTLQNYANDLSTYLTGTDATKSKLKLDAIQRRANQFGIKN